MLFGKMTRRSAVLRNLTDLANFKKSHGEPLLISFVRNPWARYVSSLSMAISGNAGKVRTDRKERPLESFVNQQTVHGFVACAARYGRWDNYIISSCYSQLDPCPPKGVLPEAMRPWEISAPHFHPQHFFLLTDDGHLAIDLVARIEDLYPALRSLLPMVIPEQHVRIAALNTQIVADMQRNSGDHNVSGISNSRSRASFKFAYRQYYTEESKNIVSALNSVDLELFPYNF